MIDHTLKLMDGTQNGTKMRHVESRTKDFLYYYSMLLNNWYWLALGLIIGVSLFYFKLRYSQNVYKIGGSVLIEDAQKGSVSKEAITKQFGYNAT